MRTPTDPIPFWHELSSFALADGHRLIYEIDGVGQADGVAHGRCCCHAFAGFNLQFAVSKCDHNVVIMRPIVISIG